MYRTLLHILTADGVLTSTQVANLSHFPATGDLVGLTDGRVFQVYHPILKATIEDIDPLRLPDDALSTLLLKPAVDGDLTATEVGAGPPASPIHVQLRSSVFPAGAWRFIPRPIMIGDGVDIEMQGNSSVGHHAITGPAGPLLTMATLLRDHELGHGGRVRWTLPM